MQVRVDTGGVFVSCQANISLGSQAVHQGTRADPFNSNFLSGSIQYRNGDATKQTCDAVYSIGYWFQHEDQRGNRYGSIDLICLGSAADAAWFAARN